MTVEGLSLLLKAPSKDIIGRIFDIAFYKRNCTDFSRVDLSWSEMELTSSEQVEMMEAVTDIVKKALFRSPMKSSKDFAPIFPEGVDARLGKLCVQILRSRLDTWRQASTFSRISLPELLDFDWRVDLKASNANISNLSIPTGLVTMTVRDQPTTRGVMPSTSSINFEMTKDQLDTMIAGLGKIQAQLTSVSSSS